MKRTGQTANKTEQDTQKKLAKVALNSVKELRTLTGN
jgi:hypothetical protein